MNFIAVQKNNYYREIHRRISGITDLQALQVKCHADCYHLIKNSIHPSKVIKKVAPRSLMIDTAMEQIYTYIEENDDCQFTMQELRNAITTKYIPDEKTIRKWLIDRYHDDIVVSCFCASYKDATLCEASATFATPPEIKPGRFAQFVRDNADFNINNMKFNNLHKSGKVNKNVNEDSNNTLLDNC
ncbi:hypothetical protein TNCV_197141 [Trichonephila clavipes]|nr:hypothetical protein TNCV_197141 [Trichonephila clavipes]